MTHGWRYLSVKQDVDDRIVEGGALGKKGWDGHEHRPEVSALIGEDVQGDTCVW